MFFFCLCSVDPDDADSASSPAKRSPFYYTPPNYNTHPLTTCHSLSSCSSPDHPSDSNSNHCSGDEDSGSEPAFIAHSSLTTAASHTPVSNPLSCDTRQQSNSFAFVKPRYVAPQSPLAAGVSALNSHAAVANSHEQNRKSTIGPNSYSFAPVERS